MSVTLLSMVIGNPAGNVGTSGTIRYYLNRDIVASDGTKYLAGRPDSKDYFLSNTWTVAGGLLTVPAKPGFPTTTDAQPNNAKVSAEIYDSKGVHRGTLFKDFFIPADPSSPLTLLYLQVVNVNPLPIRDTVTLSRAEFELLLAEAISTAVGSLHNANTVASGLKGDVYLSTAPVSDLIPIAASDTDPRLSNARIPTGAAGGELGGTFPSPTVSNAVSANTASAIVRRTAAGNTHLSTLNLEKSEISVGSTLKVLSDSIGAGSTGPSDSAHAYINLLAAEKGWTVTNVATIGACMPDQADELFATVPARTYQQYWLALGANDERLNGVDLGKQQVFADGMANMAAFLAIPNSMKYLGSDTTNITYAGSWSTQIVYGGFGKVSATNGSTATWKASGSTLYLGTAAQNGAPGTFTLTVDGVVVGSYTTLAAGTIATLDGAITYAPRLIRVTGLVAGEHTVVLTVTSATDVNNAVYVEWVGGNGGVNFIDGPQVYLATLTRQTAAGYIANGGSDANTYSYSQSLRSVAQFLGATDGLNVTLVDFGHFQFRDASLYTTDGIHIGDAGNAIMADLAIQATNSIAYARDHAPVSAVFEGSWTPTILGESSAGTTTYTSQVGRYIREGKKVTVTAEVAWSGMTGTGNLLLGGLPYRGDNLTNFSQPVLIAPDSLTFASGVPYGLIAPTAVNISLYYSATNAASQRIQAEAAATIRMSATYFTDAP